MDRGMLSSLRIGIILTLVSLSIATLPTAFAEHGRDFSASYDLQDEAPVGADRASITLSLRLQNHSGADITDAEVSLQDSLPSLKSLGVFPARLTLANHGIARLSGTFIVPVQYLAEWRTGQQPHVVVRYMSAQGRRIHRPVELLFMPGVGR